MSSLIDLIGNQIGGANMAQMGKALGLDSKKVGLGVAAALPLLLGALAKNAKKKEGAESLHKALERDHDGSVFNDLGGLMNDPDRGHGDGILRHVLGNKRQGIEAGLGRSAGMDPAAAGGLMKMLAPMVMGALGKARKEKGMDVDGLSGFLREESQQIEKKAPALGGLASMLDADGDGDVDFSDIAKQGSGLLGRFLKGNG